MTAFDPAALLDLIPTRPRVLALGEPTHDEEDLLDLRNVLFRHLVEREGYRTIAIESDCLKGLVVDDHVTTGAGTLDDAMARGFSHGWGAAAGNRELVRWMRAHNETAAEQVRFAGFDGPLEIAAAESPRQALTGLYDHLAAHVELPCAAGTLDDLLGPDDRWTEPAAMRDPSRSIGRTPQARELRLLADDLVALLDAHAPDLATDREAWDRARLYGRTAVGLLRYHHAMADPSPARMTGMLGVRDSMMAATLLALAERGPILVHAQNAHLQREISAIRMEGQEWHWWSAGSIVHTHVGRDYAFLATAVGTLHHRGVGAPPPDTIEGLLSARGEERLLVDPRALPDGLTPRVSPWFGYAPLDPAHLPTIDGIVFLRDARQAG